MRCREVSTTIRSSRCSTRGDHTEVDSMVDSAPGPEPQAGHLPLSPLRASSAGAERAHAADARGRFRTPASRAYRLRPYGAPGGQAPDPRRVAQDAAAWAEPLAAADGKVGFSAMAREL